MDENFLHTQGMKQWCRLGCTVTTLHTSALTNTYIACVHIGGGAFHKTEIMCYRITPLQTIYYKQRLTDFHNVI